MTDKRRELNSQLQTVKFRSNQLLKKIQKLNDLAVCVTIDGTDVANFNVRSNDLQLIYEDFCKCQCEIIRLKSRLDLEDINEEETNSTLIDELYYHILTVKENVLSTSQPSPRQVSAPQVKLPRITLPSFSSCLKDWPPFHDLFSSLIHENKSLSDIEKFQYLISCVQNEALSLIKTVPITSDNYIIAWTSLVKRYQNKRLLASSYLDAIFNIEPLICESPKALRYLTDVLSENLGALKSLGFPVSEWSFILLHITLHKIDANTTRLFEIFVTNSEIPTFDQLINFLSDHCRALEAAENSNNNLSCKPIISTTSNKLTGHRPSSKPISGLQQSLKTVSSAHQKAFVVSTEQTQCLYCKQPHSIYKCADFLSKSCYDRRDWIKSERCCFNCLRPNHMLKQCMSKTRCRHCGHLHHTLLHTDLAPKPQVQHVQQVRPSEPSSVKAVPGSSKQENVSASLQSCTGFAGVTTTVLLGTAIAHIQDYYGQFQEIRILLDSASQSSFITEACVQRLCLPRQRCRIPVSGISSTPVSSSKGMVSCLLKPHGSPEPQIRMNAIILKNITPFMPSVALSSKVMQQFENLQLADACFDVPGHIDALLGADVFPDVFDGGRLVSSPGYPTPFHTIFGWVLIGKAESLRTFEPLVSSCCASIGYSLDEQLKCFWAVEEAPIVQHTNPEDDACEKSFVNTHSRNSCGRYIVKLPFKEDSATLGLSCQVAVNRLQQLERRLARQPQLKEAYHQFMTEYEKLGHMELVDSCKEHLSKYIIPHHPVIKESSSTTKLRVVFDASVKTSSGKSLNDILLIGPKLQKDIVEIIYKFRLHQIVFTADICKMYRQVLIHPDHQPYQIILWRSSPEHEIKHYALKTVTYGTSSAPFLAMRALQQLTLDEGPRFPLASQILQNDVYVDDIITGATSLQDALKLKQELVALLNEGGFQLRKWSSNHPEFLSGICREDREVPVRFDPVENQVIKVLGIEWLPNSDAFVYKVKVHHTLPTKRSVLSSIARLFDPLGWMTPIILWAKRLLQHLWTLGLSWDDALPEPVKTKWTEFVEELPLVEQINVPRLILPTSLVIYQLHGFADASQDGYAAVVYLRTVDSKSIVSVHLVAAKSKVAPAKQLSIPKLELCGAYLLAKLVHFSVRTLSVHIPNLVVYAWSDSTVTLSWIRTSSYLLKTFVANRVSEIQNLIPPSQWRHVPSTCNPADCASRGLLPSQLINHELWWKGPDWLLQDQQFWPVTQSLPSHETLPEVRSNVFTTTVSEYPLLDSKYLERFSSLSRLQRVTAWCRRFIINAQRPFKSRLGGSLSTRELRDSLLVIIKIAQATDFATDIKSLHSNQSCSAKTQRLHPFLDESGILRVGGRIRHSALSYDAKHPILMSKSSYLTTLTIDYYHVTYLHVGPRTLQSILQSKFWIMSARQAIRKRLFKCNRCFRLKAPLVDPFMADLPAVRVQQARPFLHSGVDFGGPFTTKSDRTRKPQLQKSYLCLFICLSTKAVHLEAVSSLSTDAFLAALLRFVSRRGIVSNLYSDRGTNFIGANRELGEMHRLLQNETDSMSSRLSHRGITWHFNPPAAPHFGGIWEAGIKSAKHHIKRVIGMQVLTLEELSTLFTQVEAVLNSRPLCDISTDPNELEPLTPGHFLIGQPLTTIPQPDLTPLKLKRLSRWQLVQQATQHFWNRWNQEYLHTLQQRGKWTKQQANLKVDDLVLIRDDNTPPMCWKLGRIQETHPSKDGTVRVVTLRTQHGTLVRPVVKLCLLPTQ